MMADPEPPTPPLLRDVSKPLPSPPYPGDVTTRGYALQLRMEQVVASNTWLLAGPELRPWLLMLWSMSWLQIPAGSIPDDDEVIAALIGMPPTLFVTHRKTLLRGWERHTDGRRYHHILTDRVLEMLRGRQYWTERKRAERATQAESVPSQVIDNKSVQLESNWSPTAEVKGKGKAKVKNTSVVHVTPVPIPRVEQDVGKAKVKTTVATCAKKPAQGTTRETKTGEVWDAYSAAYADRYGVTPPRNQRVNAHLAQFVDLVGKDNAPGVASHFLRSNRQLYASAKHPTNLLLRDAEALYTEWATRTHGTNTEARLADETQARGNAARAVIEDIRNGKLNLTGGKQK